MGGQTYSATIRQWNIQSFNQSNQRQRHQLSISKSKWSPLKPSWTCNPNIQEPSNRHPPRHRQALLGLALVSNPSTSSYNIKYVTTFENQPQTIGLWADIWSFGLQSNAISTNWNQVGSTPTNYPEWPLHFWRPRRHRLDHRMDHL